METVFFVCKCSSRPIIMFTPISKRSAHNGRPVELNLSADLRDLHIRVHSCVQLSTRASDAFFDVNEGAIVSTQSSAALRALRS